MATTLSETGMRNSRMVYNVSDAFRKHINLVYFKNHDK